MNKKFAAISICVFMAILILPSACWLGLKVVSLADGGVMESLDFDLGENRNKAEFPKEFGQDLTAELEAYYNDRLPFRSVAIFANRKLTSLLETPYHGKISPFLYGLFYDEQPGAVLAAEDEAENPENLGRLETTGNDALWEQEEKGNDYLEVENETGQIEEASQETLADAAEGEKSLDTYLAPKIYNNATIEGRDKWLFLAIENSLEDYLGTNLLSNQQMDDYVNAMDRLQGICDVQGKQLYFMIAPNKEQVYAEYMPSYTIESSYKRVQYLMDYIHANSEVNIIYPFEELVAEKEDFQLYYKNDTHWNNAGAFIGVQALYRMMGVETMGLSEIEVEQIAFEHGDLVSMGNLNLSDYTGDINYQVKYKTQAVFESEQGNQFDALLYHSVTPSAEPCNFVMIGDSFKANMSQYLVRDFSDCTFCHMQNISDPALADALEKADIIVIESVERYDFTLPDTINGVCSILEQ